MMFFLTLTKWFVCLNLTGAYAELWQEKEGQTKFMYVTIPLRINWVK